MVGGELFAGWVYSRHDSRRHEAKWSTWRRRAQDRSGGNEVIDDFVGKSAKDAKPFFLWYAPIMPHTPHDPPERLLVKYREKTPSLPVAKYWAMCEWFDETIGQLREILEKHSVAKNTIIVYVCDNGWINDEKESKYAPRSKRSPNEGGVRTPIIIHWPNKVAPQMDDQHLASSIDLVPTVLSAIGSSQPRPLPGINLLDARAVEARKFIFGEIFEHDIVSMDNPQDSLMYRWVIEGNWKLIAPYTKRMKGEAVKLYDLSRDASEEKDLSIQNPSVVSRLQGLLDKHWTLTP